MKRVAPRPMLVPSQKSLRKKENPEMANANDRTHLWAMLAHLCEASDEPRRVLIEDAGVPVVEALLIEFDLHHTGHARLDLDHTLETVWFQIDEFKVRNEGGRVTFMHTTARVVIS